MKPVRLTLQAFGSYPGELTVDFARLARHGIFAITGPTGAGKSTIFDALVYALYDDLPGFRSDGTVRSQYAADDVETRVRLELDVRGDRWVIERTPTQHLRRRWGSGAVSERKSTVVLQRLDADGVPVDGTALSRKAAVVQAVDDLVGLTKGQFEQVVLIPQGRFEEVLKADTKARAVLLRRLFPVDVYSRVTVALKAITEERQQAYDAAARAYGELVSRLDGALAAALDAAGEPRAQEPNGSHAPDGLGSSEPAGGTTDRNALAGSRPADAFGSWEGPSARRHLDRLAAARQAMERRLELASAAEREAAQTLESAHRSAAAWDRWQKDCQRSAGFAAEEASDRSEADALDRARRVRDLDAALSGWEEVSFRLGALGPERTELGDRVGAALADLDLIAQTGGPTGTVAQRRVPADAGEARALSSEAGRLAETLRGEMRRFATLVTTRAALDGRAGALGDRRAQLDARAVHIDDVARELDADVAELDAVREPARREEATRLAVDALAAERGRSARRSEAQGALEALTSARALTASAVARSQENLEGVRLAWRTGLAGRLSELLVDGDPCPTCGAREHPRPAPRANGAPDDADLASAEAALENARRELGAVEKRLAAARGALDALDDARPLELVVHDLAVQRDELAACTTAAARLVALEPGMATRRRALDAEREALAADGRALEVAAATLEAEVAALRLQEGEYEARHGGLMSPERRVRASEVLVADVDRLAQILAEEEGARAEERQYRAVLGPVMDDLEVDDPAALAAWRLTTTELAGRADGLRRRAEQRAEVRRRIAEYDAAGGTRERPRLAPLEEAAGNARVEHLALVRRHGVMEENAAFVVAGPDQLETAGKERDEARRALEQARTLADRCAGVGGGASTTRLSLENWVLADYLRQVLVQANARLASMTGGRFSLQLSDGATDGRKQWGLDLSAFDAFTGQVRPATTLSGGETFMAALALALGLADVVSGGSNRQMGALFVDEGFGSLDAQALDAVVEVLRSLEDGGRLVGVVSHVDAVQDALPAGITVSSTPTGSVAEVHYPPE